MKKSQIALGVAAAFGITAANAAFQNYTITPIAEIGAPSYYFDSSPYGRWTSADLNNNGQVAGSYRAESEQRYIFSWDKQSGLQNLWQQPGRQDITTTVVISDSGQVGQGGRIGDSSGYQDYSFSGMDYPRIIHLGSDGSIGVTTGYTSQMQSQIISPQGTATVIDDFFMVSRSENGNYVGIVDGVSCVPADDGLGNNCAQELIANIDNQDFTLSLIYNDSNGGFVMDVNDAGQALWWTADSLYSGRVFENGSSTTLSGKNAIPWAINSQGEIVGSVCDGAGCKTSAVIWRDGNYTLLEDLISGDLENIHLVQSVDISESGDILAEGYMDNTQYFFHLTAVPVPASVWLFGSALGLLVWTKRRTA